VKNGEEREDVDFFFPFLQGFLREGAHANLCYHHVNLTRSCLRTCFTYVRDIYTYTVVKSCGILMVIYIDNDVLEFPLETTCSVNAVLTVDCMRHRVAVLRR